MNASRVSRFLAKSYKRSTTETTMVRGYSMSSAGFIVTQRGNGVLVSYTSGDWTSMSVYKEVMEKETQMKASLRQTLIEDGFILSDQTDSIMVIGKLERKAA